MAMGIQGKKEGIPVIEYGRQDGLNKRIIGIDQHVISLEAWERKGQMQHSTRGIVKQGMPEMEPTVRWCSSTIPRARQDVSAARNSCMKRRFATRAGRDGCIGRIAGLPLQGDTYSDAVATWRVRVFERLSRISHFRVPPLGRGNQHSACCALKVRLLGDGWLLSRPSPWITAPLHTAHHRPSRPAV
jgi:hypothetical protein